MGSASFQPFKFEALYNTRTVRRPTHRPAPATLIRACRDANLPKFLAADLPLFNAILSDLFPGVVVPATSYGELESVLLTCMQEKRLRPALGHAGRPRQSLCCVCVLMCRMHKSRCSCVACTCACVACACLCAACALMCHVPVRVCRIGVLMCCVRAFLSPCKRGYVWRSMPASHITPYVAGPRPRAIVPAEGAAVP